jgi:hypothetical protein
MRLTIVIDCNKERCHYAFARDWQLRNASLDVEKKSLVDKYGSGEKGENQHLFKTTEAYLWTNNYELSIDTLKYYWYESCLHAWQSEENAKIVAYGWEAAQPDQGIGESSGKQARHDQTTPTTEEAASLDLGVQTAVAVLNHQNKVWTTYIIFSGGEAGSGRYIGWSYLCKLGHGYKPYALDKAKSFTMADGTQRDILGTTKLQFSEDGEWKTFKVKVLRDM